MKSPLSAEEVYLRVSKKINKSDKVNTAKRVDSTNDKKVTSPDLVTVYRTLETFCKLGVVHKVIFDDKKARYELVHGAHGHCHHAVCKSCGETEHIHDSRIEQILSELTQSFKVVTRVHDHLLEFFGTCKSCSELGNKVGRKR